MERSQRKQAIHDFTECKIVWIQIWGLCTFRKMSELKRFADANGVSPVEVEDCEDTENPKVAPRISGGPSTDRAKGVAFGGAVC